MRGRSAKTINVDDDPRVITNKFRNVEEMSESNIMMVVINHSNTTLLLFWVLARGSGQNLLFLVS